MPIITSASSLVRSWAFYARTNLGFSVQAPATRQPQVGAAATGTEEQSPAGAARHKGGQQLGT